MELSVKIQFVSGCLISASGEMSDIELSESSSSVRLVACSSPVKSVMLALDASRSSQRSSYPPW